MLRILNIENQTPDEEIWWLKHLPDLGKDCELSSTNVDERNVARSLVPLLRLYLKLSCYDYVITHQDGYATFLFSFLNSLLHRNRGKHFINEFITSEKTTGLRSFLKYQFLRFSLSSVECIMCSSRGELAYYKDVLKLPCTKFRYVPLATNPSFLEVKTSVSGDYIISSGRTGRDYETLLRSIEGLPVRLIIVADHFNLSSLSLPDNVEAKYNILLDELIDLTAHAKFAVIPLQGRAISVGQSVLLQAMSLGKATVVTKINATLDYVIDGETCLFVEPGDSDGMRRSILQLWNDPDMAARIGVAAKRTVTKKHLPQAKILRIWSIMEQSRKV